MARVLDTLIQNDSSQIYIALRLFDIAEKVKAEHLEKAVLDGIDTALKGIGYFFNRHFTFVPFRDSAQGENAEIINTESLYQNDIKHLNRSVILVAYLDGLSKDEGVCFELGYASATGVVTLLISTDFITQRTANGIEFPFEPIIYFSANRIIRSTMIVKTETSFQENLLATQKLILSKVTEATYELLYSQSPIPITTQLNEQSNKLSIFMEFGGEQFEWQAKFADELSEICDKYRHIVIYRPQRYKGSSLSSDLESLVQKDLANIRRSSLIITCSDSEECPAGSAFVQGYARGLNKEIWMYNSKKSSIAGAGGYTSSRNLMLDYSANKTFSQFKYLLHAIEQKANAIP